MSGERDEGQHMGLLAAMMVVSLLLVGLLLGLTTGRAQPPQPPQPPPAHAAPEPLIDAPLSGELTGTVYFDAGSARLDAHALAELASVARVLLARPQATVQLSGFHDKIDDSPHAADLALQRAQGVRNALVGLGLGPQQLALRRATPTAPGEPAALARRVEVRRLD
jgi:outer membrane protein OmpA-like peptidoglycan-associated protein